MPTDVPTPSFSTRRRVAAWGVHLFTAMGLPLAFVGAGALASGDAALFFLMLWATAIVDSVDGTLARLVDVKRVVPGFDGALLDNLIDFLTFVFLPVLALPALGLLPPGQTLWAVVPLLASAYQFCQATAKTDESFVGFPSYWNVVVLYLYVLDAHPAWTIGLITALSALVFVPTHYLYPSRTRWMRPVTLGFGVVWGLAVVAMSLAPDSAWAEMVGWVSLAYPVYYMLASFVHDRRVRASEPQGHREAAG